MVGVPTGNLELAAFGAAKLGLHKEMEACLIKEPGALNRRDEKGRACLHHAANYGFEDCLDALLGRPEIETDARDGMGDTALHLAAINGFPMCAFNLTKAAPKTCLTANNAGLTAIDVAVANDRGEVLNAMLLACAGINSAEALKSITALLKAGAVPDTWAPNGSSALMLAAAVDSVEALQVLLKNGATVELQDALGRTALMFAAGSGAVGALPALLDAGASLAARDRRGKGILDYAAPDSSVRTILEDRMKVLEAAAEQLQAALLASLDEESSSKQAAAHKSKRKGGKKGKRSKKDGATTPLAQPPIAESTAPEDEAKEEAEVESTKEELAQAEPSGRREEPHSEAESSSTAADDDRGAAAAAAAIAASSAEALGLHKDARASTSEDEEDWKVVGKSARKLHGKGAAAAAQTTVQPQMPLQQQPTGTATPPQQRPAPYKRCPSATSLSDSTCSAESEQSVASAAHAPHHPAAQQNHQHPQQPQQQNGVSSQACQCVSARPAAAGAAKLATPPKPAPPRIAAQHDASSGAQAANRDGTASTAAGPAGRLADGKQIVGPRAPEVQVQRVSQPDTWAGKVAGTASKQSPQQQSPGSMNASSGPHCATSPPSRQVDPPCARPQAGRALSPGACDGQRSAVGRAASLPAPDAVPLQASTDELAAARADAAVVRRECLLLAAEVERLRTALACSEAARQQEVAQLLQKAAHHESLAVEEAIQQEKAAMTGRLLSTFESLKALNVLPGQPLTPTPASIAPSKGVMGALLDIQPGVVIGSRLQPSAAFPPAAVSQPSAAFPASQPFSAFGSPPRASGQGMAGAASLGAATLGAELSSLLCGMGAGSIGSVTPEGFAPAPLGRCNAKAQPAAEPFSFFNGSSSIWK